MDGAKKETRISGGEAFLRVLKERGVDYFFANAGTDFPPIIEALSKHMGGDAVPVPVTVPHENLAIAMAHGHTMISGRPQAVMLHVNVGTANAICNLFNAAREQVPVLLFAGRTPIHEEGAPGARSVYIHWGQEMYDQGGMLREVVKWDYELRYPEQVADAVDRAIAVAESQPRGPIYMTLPREVIAEEVDAGKFLPAGRRNPAAPPAPNPDALRRAAELLSAAEKPLIITGSYGRDPDSVPLLADLAEAHAIPVTGYRSRYVFLPTGHPMHLGYEPASLLKDADVVVALDCDVPWIPSLHAVNPDARIVHIGPDPLFARYPMRSFPADIAIEADPALAVAALKDALDAAGTPPERLEARRTRAGEAKKAYEAVRTGLVERAEAQKDVIVPPWIVHCLNRAKGEDDIVLTETVVPVPVFDFPRPGSYFANSTAGGLGWGLGAALGAKLAAPERRVIAIVGDGSYMFGNPTPAHLVAAALDLPTLTVVVNNRMWGAVRRATLGLYPDGAASKSNNAPLTHLSPSPAYEKVIEASGGHGELVERPEDLPAAIERAFAEVDKGRQALLNVITHYSDEQAVSDSKK